MAEVYILYSKKLDKFYTGSCKELYFRMEQHYNKLFANSFTSKTNDWELFCLISGLGYKQARSIEKHIKNMKSKTYINNLKKYPELIEKLRKRFE